MENLQQTPPPVIHIRDIVHAAKLLRLLEAKESLIASQKQCVKDFLKDHL